jgi:mRNA interferase RelE/StbE
MRYAVEVHRTAARALARLPADASTRITARVNALGDDPRPRGALPLRGPLKGLYRLRVGEYRVGYEVDDRASVVRIRTIGHRRDFYDVLSRTWGPQQ